MWGPLSVEYIDEGVVGDAELIEVVEYVTDELVMIDHRVVIIRLPAARLALALGLGVGEQMHVGGVEPYEERFAVLVLAPDKILGGCRKFVVAGLHALLGERAGVLDLLLADAAPTRFFSGIVLVGRPGMDDAARPNCLAHIREILLRVIIVHFRLLLGVQVIEVAEELIETVVGRQHVVQVAQVILAELSRSVALILEQRRDRHELLRHSDRRAGKADFGKSAPVNALPGDKRGSTRRAGLLAVGVGKHHPLFASRSILGV